MTMTLLGMIIDAAGTDDFRIVRTYTRFCLYSFYIWNQEAKVYEVYTEQEFEEVFGCLSLGRDLPTFIFSHPNQLV